MSDYLFRLELPPDKRSFTVAEALEATSAAIHPMTAAVGPVMILAVEKVMYPPQSHDHVGRPTELNKRDQKVLRGIWTGMDAPKFPMPLERWQPYLDAFNSSPNRPEGWSLRALQSDPNFQVHMARANAVYDHRETLKQAVQSGAITVRDPTTGLTSDRAWMGEADSWLLTRAHMKAFCDLLAIELVEGPPSAGRVSAPQVPGPEIGRLVKPQQAFPAQEAQVLSVIRQLGHEPKRLPPRQAGKPWAKAAVWGAIGVCPLFTTEKVFNKAWERLRSSAEIAERPGL